MSAGQPGLGRRGGLSRARRRGGLRRAARAPLGLRAARRRSRSGSASTASTCRGERRRLGCAEDRALRPPRARPGLVALHLRRELRPQGPSCNLASHVRGAGLARHRTNVQSRTSSLAVAAGHPTEGAGRFLPRVAPKGGTLRSPPPLPSPSYAALTVVVALVPGRALLEPRRTGRSPPADDAAAARPAARRDTSRKAEAARRQAEVRAPPARTAQGRPGAWSSARSGRPGATGSGARGSGGVRARTVRAIRPRSTRRHRRGTEYSRAFVDPAGCQVVLECREHLPQLELPPLSARFARRGSTRSGC